MELYQETRRYNSTSSWSLSCNRRVARGRGEREREKTREREKERKRERERGDNCSVDVHPTYFVVVAFLLPVPRGFFFTRRRRFRALRVFALTSDFVNFREHLSIEILQKNMPIF